MGYSPAEGLQVSLSVTPLNVSRELAAATPGQECVLSAWHAYWTARTHNVMAARRPRHQVACPLAPCRGEDLCSRSSRRGHY